MIQRIQSVYLLLAALGYSFFLLLPVFKISQPAGMIIERATENVFLVLLSVVLILGTLADVFLYKNRILQARIGWFLAGVNLFLIGLLGYHYYIESRNANLITVSWGAIFPVISLVLLILAVYHINKDEKLVRSLDRLR